MAAKRIWTFDEVDEKLKLGLCFICDKPTCRAHENVRFIFLQNEEEETDRNIEEEAISYTATTKMNQVESLPSECQIDQPEEDETQMENKTADQKPDLDFPIEDVIDSPVEALLRDHRETVKDNPVADPVREMVETGHAIVQPEEVRDNFLPFSIITTVSSASPRLYLPPKPPDVIVAPTLSHSLINFYSKCEYYTFAQQVLDEMPEQDVVSFLQQHSLLSSILFPPISSRASPSNAYLLSSSEMRKTPATIPPPKPPDAVTDPASSLNPSLSVVTAACCTKLQYPISVCYRSLPTASQVFDEMPKDLVAVWIAIILTKNESEVVALDLSEVMNQIPLFSIHSSSFIYGVVFITEYTVNELEEVAIECVINELVNVAADVLKDMPMMGIEHGHLTGTSMVNILEILHFEGCVQFRVNSHILLPFLCPCDLDVLRKRRLQHQSCRMKHSPRLLPLPEPPDRIAILTPSQVTSSRCTSTPYPGIVSYRLLPTTLQLIDQIPQEFLAVWVAIILECVSNGYEIVALNLSNAMNQICSMVSNYISFNMLSLCYLGFFNFGRHTTYYNYGKDGFVCMDRLGYVLVMFKDMHWSCFESIKNSYGSGETLVIGGRSDIMHGNFFEPYFVDHKYMRTEDTCDKNQDQICWKWQRNLGLIVVILGRYTHHYQPWSTGKNKYSECQELKFAPSVDNSSCWLVANQDMIASGTINVIRGSKSSVKSESVALIVDNIEMFNCIAKTCYSKTSMRFIILLWQERATGNFKESNIIGEDGFECVYKARLDDNMGVAIKELNCESHYAEKEFEHEVGLLSKHPNVISLLRCISNEDTRFIVYKFLQNGSLGTQLHGPSYGSALTWSMRMKIALDTARCLRYLHEHGHPLVIHRNLKSSNILLDANFSAKLSDFDLATTDESQNRCNSKPTLSVNLIFVIAHPLPKISFLIFQLVKMTVVLHRKMIYKGNVLAQRILLKWKTLPLSMALVNIHP